MIFDSMTTRELIDFKRRHGVGADSVPRSLVLDPRTPDTDDDKDCMALYVELLDAYASGGIFGGAAVDPLLLTLGFKPIEDGQRNVAHDRR